MGVEAPPLATWNGIGWLERQGSRNKGAYRVRFPSRCLCLHTPAALCRPRRRKIASLLVVSIEVHD